MPSSGGSRRVRVERGIYRQKNGKYTVCVRVDGRARFRTLQAATLVEARAQRELLQRAGRLGDLPLSPRLTFEEVSGRWLAEFEAKVAADEKFAKNPAARLQWFYQRSKFYDERHLLYPIGIER